MRYIAAIIASLAASVALAQTSGQGNIARLGPDFTQQAQRACLFPSGGWTIIDCSNAAAVSSAQLNAWSRYVIQCGDDSYFAPGTAASGQDADTNDGWVPANAWLEFLTTDTLRYVSVRNKNSDSDCRILECR